MTHYTSKEQSKHLLELGLSPETADMYYMLPYWSLGALIELLPEQIQTRDWYNYKLVLEKHKVSYVRIEDLDEYSKIFCWFEDEDLLDAVYQMACFLLETCYIKKGGII